MLDPDYGFTSSSRPFIPNPVDNTEIFDIYKFDALNEPGLDITDLIETGWLPFQLFLRSLDRRHKEEQLERCLGYTIEALSQFQPEFKFNLEDILQQLIDLRDAVIYRRLPVPRAPIPQSIVRSIKDKYLFTCSYCKMSGSESFGPDGRVWNIDHIQPVSKGGTDAEHNLCLSCATCNSLKGVYHRDAYKSVLAELKQPLHIYLSRAPVNLKQVVRWYTKELSSHFENQDDMNRVCPTLYGNEEYYGA